MIFYQTNFAISTLSISSEYIRKRGSIRPRYPAEQNVLVAIFHRKMYPRVLIFEKYPILTILKFENQWRHFLKGGLYQFKNFNQIFFVIFKLHQNNVLIMVTSRWRNFFDRPMWVPILVTLVFFGTSALKLII